ncbi:hypothetical protein M407DRAFT_31375 [Tulasnella calospora MUT 4182]|uniref:Xylanolytic transcriptional activator regulatory domain-containing protein n=1 Tax=Tulasnella calospora MUT 4182 TaxID=1051891 RepID=A0A0C3LBV3_9AGAM|nr:hypothetical protein M407DRAFT_31375 [Tulasnella calospora MUT 4182]
MSSKRKLRESCPACVRSGRVCDGLVPECMYYRRSAPLNPTRPRQIRNKEEEMYLEEHIRELEQRLETLSSASSTPRASPNIPSRPISSSPRAQDSIPNVFRGRPQDMTGEWWKPALLRRPIQDYLVQIFLAYAGQHHIQVDGPGLLRALQSFDPAEQPHPALLDSIYLFACSCTDSLPLASPLSLVRLEDHFLTRARKDMNDSLAFADRLLDYLKASNIIAAYLLRRGRHLEGYHHHSGAARLAMACGLHHIYSPTFPPHVQEPLPASTEAVALLRPPSSQMQVADRIFTFWNTFVQDQIYAIVHGFAPALDERLEDIRTPLPRPLVEYEQNDIRLQDIDYLYKVFQSTQRQPNRAESAFASFIKSLALLHSARVGLANRVDDLASIIATTQSFRRFLTGMTDSVTDGTNLMDRFLYSAIVCTQTALLQLFRATGPSGATELVNIASSLADTVRSPYNEQLARGSQLIMHCLKFTQAVLEQHRQQLVGNRSGVGSRLPDVEERISMLSRVTTPD